MQHHVKANMAPQTIEHLSASFQLLQTHVFEFGLTHDVKQHHVPVNMSSYSQLVGSKFTSLQPTDSPMGCLATTFRS